MPSKTDILGLGLPGDNNFQPTSSFVSLALLGSEIVVSVTLLGYGGKHVTCCLQEYNYSLTFHPLISSTSSRAVELESVTWDSSRLESVILRLETWLETWAFGLETWLVTWRLELGLDSRLAANDLDHKSDSQVTRKTKSLYNLSFDISIKYNFSISCSILVFFFILILVFAKEI